MRVISVLLLMNMLLSAQETHVVPKEHKTLQGAIDAANDGDTIHVLPGRYAPFILKGKYVRVTSEAGAAKTTIAGGAPNAIIRDNNRGKTIIEGFTFEHGKGYRHAMSKAQGGAIWLKSTNVVISDCIFRKNRAKRGGALWAGAETRVVLENCHFQGNLAEESGGAIAADSGSPWLDVRRSRFVGNRALRFGGALALGAAGAARISNSVFVKNAALDLTGRRGSGGAAYNGSTGILRVTNCNFTRNVAALGEASCVHDDYGTSKILNSILWANAGKTPLRVSRGQRFQVTTSCVQGGYKGVGNIEHDPLWRDPANGDYRLKSSSPCIDTGSTAVLGGTPLFDLDEQNRVCGTAVDMGAFEMQVRERRAAESTLKMGRKQGVSEDTLTSVATAIG